MKLLVISICFFIQSTAFGQLTDTIKYSLKQKPKFFFTLSTFNTSIDGQFANISIVKVGLGFNQRLRFGIGYSTLANNAVTSDLHITENGQNYTTNGNLNFGYGTFSVEYFFYRSYPWEFSVTPLNFGIGSARYNYVNRPERLNVFTPSETIVLFQPEIGAQYNIFKWLGVGVVAGYRSTLYRSKQKTANLSAPVFAIELRLFLDEVYELLFKKEKEEL